MASIPNARFLHSPNSLPGGVPGSKGTPARGLQPLTFSQFPMRTLWDSHPHAHSHTLSRAHPSQHSDKATWGHRGTLGPCMPEPLATTHHPAIPRCALISQSTLRREVWRGLRSDTLDSLPLGLTDAADKKQTQDGGTKPKSRSSKNARGCHPDQKPWENQPVGKACTNEGGDS